MTTEKGKPMSEQMDVPENFVALTRYRTADEAIYHREVLENAGIPVIVDNAERSQIQNPAFLETTGQPAMLMVPEERAREAATLIEENTTREMEE
jgi:hypothetical protein